MDNGDILVTEIPGSWISRITREGKVVWSVRPAHPLPVRRFPTHDGQVIVADLLQARTCRYLRSDQQAVTWEYPVPNGEKMLDHPSLAIELPNGNVVLNDDRRHRVVVIDRKTKEIVWQYGVTDRSGYVPGFLNYPDGLDVDVFRNWKSVAKAH